jgi:aminoglycoside phosphotransferase (APT) family kinase protein
VTQDRQATSTRDREQLVARFEAWLRAITGDAAATALERQRSLDSGFSSDTTLLEISWRADGTEHRRETVLRLPPTADAWPVFPSYDLGRQVAAMRAVAAAGTAPVPEVLWHEPDPSHLGTEFVVMERVDGVAAPDVMPYTWDSWVTQLSAAERRQLGDASIDLLAAIHAVPVDAELVEALTLHQHGGSPLRRHFSNELAYYEWAREDRRFPTIERGFDTLAARWPSPEPGPRLAWGDARLGNILFDGTTPTAVLDWEMAGLLPPAVDLGWSVFFHEHFQRSAQRQGLPGIPDLLPADAALARYERAGGTTIEDFEWYLCYAAVREAIISIRTMGRAVHLAQVSAPDDPEGLILGREYVVELTDALART